MTNDEVHVSVLQWLKSVTGHTAIKANQGGTSPPLPYLMVNLLAVRKVRQRANAIRYEETEELNEAGEKIVLATPEMVMEWHFSVHAYGDQPTDLLRPVASRMEISQAMEPAYPALHVHEVSQIRNVPDFIKNAWQPRAQMDLFVHGITRDQVEADVIDDYSLDINPEESTT